MSEKMTDAEFAAKIEWEGGVITALEYGLRSDMLADSSSDLGEAWAALETAWKNSLKELIEDVESEVEEVLGEDA